MFFCSFFNRGVGGGPHWAVAHRAKRARAVDQVRGARTPTRRDGGCPPPVEVARPRRVAGAAGARGGDEQRAVVPEHNQGVSGARGPGAVRGQGRGIARARGMARGGCGRAA